MKRKQTVLYEWNSDSGRLLLAERSDSTYLIGPFFVTEAELAELGEAIADALLVVCSRQKTTTTPAVDATEGSGHDSTNEPPGGASC